MPTDPPGDQPQRPAGLARAERRLLIGAAVALPAIALALRALPLRRVVGLLSWRASAASAEPQPERAERAAHLVDVAARRGLHGGNCLSRSVTLWWLLRRSGIDSELRVGVRREGQALLAHAWVEHAGEPLNETAGVRDRYATFDASIIPSGAKWS